MGAPIAGVIDRDTVRCECGHTETIDPHGEYRVVETDLYRWRCNPETSEVWQESLWKYMCEPCWEALPDGDVEEASP